MIHVNPEQAQKQNTYDSYEKTIRAFSASFRSSKRENINRNWSYDLLSARLKKVNE